MTYYVADSLLYALLTPVVLKCSSDSLFQNTDYWVHPRVSDSGGGAEV